MEREHRFIDGLKWQLADTLEQLAAQERALLSQLAPPTPSSSSSQPQRAPALLSQGSALQSRSPGAAAGAGAAAFCKSGGGGEAWAFGGEGEEPPPPRRRSKSPETPPLYAFLALDPLHGTDGGPPLLLLPPRRRAWIQEREDSTDATSDCEGAAPASDDSDAVVPGADDKSALDSLGTPVKLAAPCEFKDDIARAEKTQGIPSPVRGGRLLDLSRRSRSGQRRRP